MKKAISISLPYLFAVVWFLYCLSEIEASVLNHFGHEWCVINSYALATAAIVVMILARLFKKEVYQYYFVPVVFFWCGYILDIVGMNINCCPSP
ncbi:MAG: hypothetical protein IJ297_05105 [Clostridia bacterium]|nr:hypothetical protein [Clostridia bacterium]